MYMRNLWPMSALPDPGALVRDLERMIDAVSRGAGIDSGRGSYPPVNVTRDEERLRVRALLPGIDPDKLQVSVERNKLTIAGERSISPEPGGDGSAEEEMSYHRQERTEGFFSRTITLDTIFDSQGVEASYGEGILTITLPLASGVKPRLIPVQTT